MDSDERQTVERLVMVVVVGGIVGKIAGMFDDKPGGDVDPAAPDPRPATIEEAYANSLADTIEVAVWGDDVVEAWTEDDELFAACLVQCQVTADVRVLMNAFGERGTHFQSLTLAETVASYLDDDYKAAVNEDYRSKGITILWP